MLIIGPLIASAILLGVMYGLISGAGYPRDPNPIMMDLNDRNMSRDPEFPDLSQIPDVSFAKPPSYDEIEGVGSWSLPPKYEDIVKDCEVNE